MAQGARAARVAEQIQRDAARILLEKADDPLLRAVTITAVRVSPDLRHARILFSTDPAQREATERRARKFEPFLQRELAGRLRLRYVPEIALRFDEGFEDAMKLERIFAELGSKGGATGGDGSGTPPSAATEAPGSGPDDGEEV
jgi:ribosome-binding factor A